MLWYMVSDACRSASRGGKLLQPYRYGRLLHSIDLGLLYRGGLLIAPDLAGRTIAPALRTGPPASAQLILARRSRLHAGQEEEGLCS